MTQYNSLNVKLSNSQLNKLKSAIKNAADVVLRLSSNMIGNSDDETNFTYKLYPMSKCSSRFITYAPSFILSGRLSLE